MICAFLCEIHPFVGWTRHAVYVHFLLTSQHKQCGYSETSLSSDCVLSVHVCRMKGMLKVGFQSASRLWVLTHTHANRVNLVLSWKPWQAWSPAVCMQSCHHPENTTMNISLASLSVILSLLISLLTQLLWKTTLCRVSLSIVCHPWYNLSLFSIYATNSLSTDILDGRCEDAGVSIFSQLCSVGLCACVCGCSAFPLISQRKRQ